MLGRSRPAGGPLERADVAHCAVFTVGFATAHLWRHWGVAADGLLGYSLGEYTAACLAGVFDLADAVLLVARRARLLQRLPAGGMLAVALPPHDLPAGLHTAAYTGPGMTVVAGPVAPLDEYERALTARGVAHRRVETGHALHTPMLAALRDDVIRLVAAVPRHEPHTPFVSSVTGTWITADRARDPEYWADQMCRPVRFADGLACAADRPGSVLLELGPGQALTSIALQAGAPALSTFGPGDDREHALTALGRLWAAGHPVTWENVGGGGLVDLPTYPFEHQRFWPGSGAAPPAEGALSDLADWCYAPVWKQSAATPRPGATAARWLVLADDDVAAGALRAEGHDVVVVSRSWRISGRITAEILQDRGAEGLVELLAAHGWLPDGVLHAWDLPGIARYLSVMDLARALARRCPAVRLFAMTAGAHEVVGGDGTAPEQATVIGLCQTLDQEFPHLTCRGVDTDPHTAVDRIVAELTGDAGEPYVAYRNGRRWVRAWEPAPLPATTPEAAWRDSGVYLITGGFGGLGLILARYLAKTVRARLVLVGRQPLPPRERWDGDDERVAAVRELEALGAEVLPLAADVADAGAVAAAVAEARRRFGTVHGVIHAAGVPGGGLIQLKTRADVERVLAPKVSGTLALYEALRADPPEVFVVYSSAVVTFGGLGESDYCAANAFVDAFCWQARRAGFPATSVNWGPWRYDSWTATVHTGLRELRDRYGITDDDGTELLTRIVAAAPTQVLVVPQDPAVLAERWRALSADLLAPPVEPPGTHPRPALRTPFVPARTDPQRRVAAIWQRHLGVDRVGMDDAFFELGGNSLIGLTIVAQVEKDFGVRVSAADLFAAPTPGAMAALLAERTGTGAAPGGDPGAGRGQRRRRLARTAAARRQNRGTS
jgi:phthiocerol/phenolphthiocerol synthesis type-I polyketide synthase E